MAAFLKRINRLRRIICLCIGGVILLTAFIYHFTALQVSRHAYDEIDKLPHNTVALVLGTVRYLGDGTENEYFTHRIEAAEKLYLAKKIDKILVSGDHDIEGYNEPIDMRDALIERGIPSQDILLDYHGYRTLDSIIRAHEVFKLDSLTVVSQTFHNHRALYISHYHGIHTVAYNARDVSGSKHLFVYVREHLARLMMMMDLYVLDRKPQSLERDNITQRDSANSRAK